MIRINRLIKRNAICEILELPHVAKIEILRRKSNQKDKSVVRIQIYLTRSCDGRQSAEFNGTIGAMLNNPNISEHDYNTIKNALHNGFIKESTYNKLSVRLDKKYSELCQRYNQAFFDTF